MVEDFRDVLRALSGNRARFMVVGAHALAAHGVSGLTFDDAWNNRIETVVEDVRVQVLGRESFVRNKRASGRKKDLADLEALGIE